MPAPSRSLLPDRQVVDAVLAGDRESFRELVERESASVIAICTSVLHDHEEALDVAQDAFVQAYRALATYRGEGTFGAWIGRIATRLAVARAVARARGLSTTQIDPTELDGRAALDVAADVEELVLEKEHATALLQAVATLSADMREVVTLRFYRDMPLDQIAVEIGAPIGTVKSRLHRALVRLRREASLRSVP